MRIPWLGSGRFPFLTSLLGIHKVPHLLTPQQSLSSFLPSKTLNPHFSRSPQPHLSLTPTYYYLSRLSQHRHRSSTQTLFTQWPHYLHGLGSSLDSTPLSQSPFTISPAQRLSPRATAQHNVHWPPSRGQVSTSRPCWHLLKLSSEDHTISVSTAQVLPLPRLLPPTPLHPPQLHPSSKSTTPSMTKQERN